MQKWHPQAPKREPADLSPLPVLPWLPASWQGGAASSSGGGGGAPEEPAKDKDDEARMGGNTWA